MFTPVEAAENTMFQRPILWLSSYSFSNLFIVSGGEGGGRGDQDGEHM